MVRVLAEVVTSNVLEFGILIPLWYQIHSPTSVLVESQVMESWSPNMGVYVSSGATEMTGGTTREREREKREVLTWCERRNLGR